MNEGVGFNRERFPRIQMNKLLGRNCIVRPTLNYLSTSQFPGQIEEEAFHQNTGG
jgi:hypothetical protein